MNTKFKKALSDLLINPGRTALVIIALVIGLWGVGSIIVTYTILKNDLNENYTRTRPPHVIMTSKDFNRLDIAAFRNRPEIESAEFRGLSLERIEVYPNQWIPLWLFGVEDFDNFRLAQIYSEQGKSVPGPGAMLMERDGLNVSDLKLGSRPRIRVGGQTLEVPIVGISFDPAQAPATQDHFVYAYVDTKTYAAITGETPNQRLIFRLQNVKSKQDIQAAANDILEYFQSSGMSIDTLNIPNPNEHPHQWQLNTLLFLEGSIGFLAFLMGAALVSQLMAAMLARQVRQIGILKAIGASRLSVFQIYGSSVLLFGVAAGALAIPLAVSSGYAFARFVSAKLNFEILTTTLPPHVYLYLIAAGLLLPLLLSLPALLKGVRVSVYDALSDYGIRQDTGGKKVGAVSRLSLPSSLILAYRNTMRRKKRLAVTVLTMALGVAIFSTGFNVRQSLALLLSDINNGMKYDVQVVLRNQMPREQALLPFGSLDNVSRIETWNGGRGELQTKVIATVDGVGIVALPLNTGLLRLRVVNGRWLRASEEPEVVMNQQAMEIYRDPAVGGYQLIDLGGKLLKVKLVGVVEELEKPKIYIDEDRYDAFANPRHFVNSLMFVAKDKSFDKITALKKDIEKAIVPSDLNVLYVMSKAERTKVIYDHLNIILTMILFLSFMVLVVSAMGMASATGINIMERTREIGVLRAIGATPKMIYGLFVAEGTMVGVVSVFLGLLLSWPLSTLASSFFGALMLGHGATLRFAFSVPGFWITLVTTLVFGWLASRIPARKAINVSTREALSYE